MKIASDQFLIDQLKSEDNAAYQLIYKFYFPGIAAFVRKNSGSVEDAQDIFQETILVLLRKIQQPDFILSSSLQTYVFAVSKNLWLKHLRDQKTFFVTDYSFEKFAAEPFLPELAHEKTREEKVNEWISKITPHCQWILKAIFYYMEPIENLIKKLGWKNKHTAANQQYKCIQQIKKIKEKEA